MRKDKPIIEFISGFGVVVEMKPLKNDVQKFGQFNELDSSLGSHLLATKGALIKVVLVKQFRLDVPLETEFDAVIVDLFVDVFDDENDVLV